MTGPSLGDSRTQCARCRIPLEEQSFTSQESCNCADPKNEESKNEPCAPGPTPTTEPATSNVQDKIVPLAGNPYFTSIVAKSQVKKPFQLVIPRSFYPFLPSTSVPVVLSCRDRNWEMRYYGHRSFKRISCGWKQFAIDNNLKVGDGCIYELMDRENLKFKVQILSGEIPSEFNKGEDGRSSDSPIMID